MPFPLDSAALPRAARCLVCVSLALALALGLLACASSGSALQLHSAPEHADADVYVDGQYVGVLGEQRAPSQSILLAPGVHRVELRKAGYFPYQHAVRVPRRGAPAKIDLHAELYAAP